MNKIILKGIIKDIQFSHYISDTEYYKANIICKNNDKEDIIPIKFKRFCNKYTEGQEIFIVGNIRTYSIKGEDGKNHVSPYVFTYLDNPDENLDKVNFISLDGNICKKGELRKTKTGLDVLDFILANNIKSNGQVFNTYIPVVAWGKQAKEISKMNIGDKLNIEGHFSSRTYKKPNKNGFDIKMAYEVNVDEIIKDVA